MKINELNQKPTVLHLVKARTDKSGTADARSEAGAKRQPGADKVELSTYMPVVPASQSRQGIRVDRVEEVKAQIASGSYQVTGRAVAEKMLSKLVASSSR